MWSTISELTESTTVDFVIKILEKKEREVSLHFERSRLTHFGWTALARQCCVMTSGDGHRPYLPNVQNLCPYLDRRVSASDATQANEPPPTSWPIRWRAANENRMGNSLELIFRENIWDIWKFVVRVRYNNVQFIFCRSRQCQWTIVKCSWTPSQHTTYCWHGINFGSRSKNLKSVSYTRPHVIVTQTMRRAHKFDVLCLWWVMMKKLFHEISPTHPGDSPLCSHQKMLKNLLQCKAEGKAISKRGCFELWIDKLLLELTKVVHFCE